MMASHLTNAIERHEKSLFLAAKRLIYLTSFQNDSINPFRRGVLDLEVELLPLNSFTSNT